MTGPAPDAGEATGARSNEDLTAAAADGFRWITYARVAIELILLGAMVLLARLITPAQFGIFAIVVIVQELALSVPMEGVGGALVQRRTISRAHLEGGSALCLCIGALLAALTALAATFLIGPVFGGEAELLALATIPSCLLGAIYAPPLALLRRRLEFRRLSLIDLLSNATRALVSVGLALAGLEAAALVFGGVAALALGVVLALCFAPVPLPRWRWREMRELLPYGGPASLAAVSWAGFRNGDYAIVAAVLGPASAGIYWRAYQIAVEYERKISVVMTQIAFPVMARTDGAAKMLELRQRMVRLLTTAVFPLLLILAILAPVLIPWVFGPAWEEAVLPTQILVIGGAATLVIDVCGSALMAAGRTRALLAYGIAHFAAYLGAVVLLVGFGLPAVAAGGAAVHIVFLGVAYQLALRGFVRNPLRVLLIDLAPAAFGCAALLAVAVTLDLALDRVAAPAVFHIAVVGLAGLGAYLLALRSRYPAAAADLLKALARLLPAAVRSRLTGRRRHRLAVEAGV